MSKPTWSGTSSISYTDTGNWYAGAVPTTSDDVILTAGAANPIDADLDQHTVVLGSFSQDMGFQQTIGDLTLNVRSSLKIQAPVVNLGTPPASGSPPGSGRIYLDMGTNATVVTVLNSRNGAIDVGQTPIHLLGSSITLNVNAGLVGVALLPGETATLTAMNVDGGAVVLGAGVTPTAISVFAGAVISSSNITAPTVTVNSQAAYLFKGAATHTLITINPGGTVTFNGSGTITQLNYAGTIDFSTGTAPVTITNATRYPGGYINDPNGRVTFTNKVQNAGGASTKDDRSDFGPNRKWIVSN